MAKVPFQNMCWGCGQRIWGPKKRWLIDDWVRKGEKCNNSLLKYSILGNQQATFVTFQNIESANDFWWRWQPHESMNWWIRAGETVVFHQEGCFSNVLLDDGTEVKDSANSQVPLVGRGISKAWKWNGATPFVLRSIAVRSSINRTLIVRSQTNMDYIWYTNIKGQSLQKQIPTN